MNPHDALSLYAADALPDDERAAFAEHLAACARCRDDLGAYGAVLDDLAGAVEEPPPARLRASVLDIVGRTPQVPGDPPEGDAPGLDDRAADPAFGRAPRMAAGRPEGDAPGRGARAADPAVAGRRVSLPRRFALAAAIVVFAVVGLGGTAVTLWQRADTRAELAARDVDQLTAVLAADDARLVDVRTEVGGTLRVAVAASLDRAVVIGDDLAAPPQDRTYQLWVIDEGQPRSAGLVDRRDGVLAEITDLAGADAVALSVEPVGGSDAPTGPIVGEAAL